MRFVINADMDNLLSINLYDSWCKSSLYTPYGAKYKHHNILLNELDVRR